METTRRGLLKLFGVGAAVVPLIGGTPDMDAAARIIDPPKVEPVVLDVRPVDPGEMLRLTGAFNRNERVMILVDVIPQNGQRVRLNAEAFLVSIDYGIGPMLGLDRDVETPLTRFWLMASPRL